MSAWSDDAPPHTWLEMPMAYGGDASALSCLAWQTAAPVRHVQFRGQIDSLWVAVYAAGYASRLRAAHRSPK